MGITEKVRRAKVHFDELETELAPFDDPDTNGFVFKADIHDNGRKHVWRVKDPPPLGPQFASIAGDCVHNLRTALDHLAWQLVLANGGDPGKHIQFPVRANPSRDPLSIAGQVSEQALQLIKAVQPETGGNDGRCLYALNELDVIDKHRHLAVIAQAIRQAVTSGWAGDPIHDMIELQLTRRPLRHDEIVAVVTYSVPHAKPDEHLRFVPQVAFDKPVRDKVEGVISAVNGPGPWAEGSLRGVLGALLYWVESELLPRFDPFP